LRPTLNSKSSPNSAFFCHNLSFFGIEKSSNGAKKMSNLGLAPNWEQGLSPAFFFFQFELFSMPKEIGIKQK
jgi:hypothetical protein